MNYRKEIGVGIFFLCLAVLYFICTFSISTFDPFASSRIGFQLDSRSVPQVLALMLGSLGIIYIIGNFLKLQKVNSPEGDNAGPKPKKTFAFKFDRTQRLMVLTVALISAYIFFFNTLGFILSSVLYLLAQMFLLIPPEKRKKWAIFTVCFSAGMPVVIYLIFTKAISMYLPRGLLYWL